MSGCNWVPVTFIKINVCFQDDSWIATELDILNFPNFNFCDYTIIKQIFYKIDCGLNKKYNKFYNRGLESAFYINNRYLYFRLFQKIYIK